MHLCLTSHYYLQTSCGACRKDRDRLVKVSKIAAAFSGSLFRSLLNLFQSERERMLQQTTLRCLRTTKSRMHIVQRAFSTSLYTQKPSSTTPSSQSTVANPLGKTPYLFVQGQDLLIIYKKKRGVADGTSSAEALRCWQDTWLYSLAI